MDFLFSTTDVVKAFEIKGYTGGTAETAEEALGILQKEEFKVTFLTFNFRG